MRSVRLLKLVFGKTPLENPCLNIRKINENLKKNLGVEAPIYNMGQDLT